MTDEPIRLPDKLSDDIAEQSQRVLGTDISTLKCLECGRPFREHGAYVTEPPVDANLREARFEGIPHVAGVYCLPGETVEEAADTDFGDE